MKFLRRNTIFVLAVTMAMQGVNLVPKEVMASDSKLEHGFKLLKETYVDSINSTVMQYEHVKSGAKLVYLKNNDTNKTFSIDFRTLPSDNTGINHIIEHSVLDGSKKYPAKNAFLNMVNQSLCNCADAATYQDYTTYYFSSYNYHDFTNMMGVTLDAVFHPKVIENSNIFLQEGGRYELNKSKTEAVYNGIVYNEIEADNTSELDPYNILQGKAIESVLPHTTYKWNVGGTIESIPKAKYKNLVNAYKKYYYPSNSYIYLYGKLDIDNVLKYLDSNWLSKYKKKKIDSSSVVEKPYKKRVEKTYYYNVKKLTKNGTSFSINYVFNNSIDSGLINSFLPLEDLLYEKLETIASEKGLGDIDVEDNGGKQRVLSIELQDTTLRKKAAFEKIVKDTLESMVKNGIAKNDIKALMPSYKKRKNKEITSSRLGVALDKRVMQSWINSDNPDLCLDYYRYIKILNKGLKERYFEKIIQKYMLNNKFSSFVTLRQKVGKVASDNSTISTKNMTQKQISKLERDEKNLNKWAAEAGSDKAVSTLPLLSASDVKIDKPNIENSTEDGVKTMFTPVDTDKSAYYNLYFDTSMIDKDEIPYINLLCSILTNETGDVYNKYNSLDSNEDVTYQNIDFSADAFGKFDDPASYSPKLSASVSGPADKLDKSLELLKELIGKWNFEDKNKMRYWIKDAYGSVLGLKYDAVGSRFDGYLSEKDKYNDLLKGVGYYNFIKDLYNNLDSKWGEASKKLKEVYDKIFNKNNLIIGFVGTKEQYSDFKQKLPNFLKDIKTEQYTPTNYSFDDSVKNEAFIGDSQNIDIREGYNIRKLGYNFNSKMYVMQAIIQDYIVDKIFVNGGYYGEIQLSENGEFNLQAEDMLSIDSGFSIFNSVPSYLENFKADDSKLMRFKIGGLRAAVCAQTTTGNPESPVQTAIDNQKYEILGKTSKDYENIVKDIMSTTVEDIQNMALMIQDILNQKVYMVYGNKKIIQANKDIFDRIIDLSGY